MGTLDWNTPPTEEEELGIDPWSTPPTSAEENSIDYMAKPTIDTSGMGGSNDPVTDIYTPQDEEGGQTASPLDMQFERDRAVLPNIQEDIAEVSNATRSGWDVVSDSEKENAKYKVEEAKMLMNNYGIRVENRGKQKVMVTSDGRALPYDSSIVNDLIAAKAETGGALAGGIAGAELGAIGGSALGPVGTAVGGIAGGLAGSMLGAIGGSGMDTMRNAEEQGVEVSEREMINKTMEAGLVDAAVGGTMVGAGAIVKKLASTVGQGAIKSFTSLADMSPKYRKAVEVLQKESGLSDEQMEGMIKNYANTLDNPVITQLKAVEGAARSSNVEQLGFLNKAASQSTTAKSNLLQEGTERTNEIKKAVVDDDELTSILSSNTVTDKGERLATDWTKVARGFENAGVDESEPVMQMVRENADVFDRYDSKLFKANTKETSPSDLSSLEEALGIQETVRSSWTGQMKSGLIENAMNRLRDLAPGKQAKTVNIIRKSLEAKDFNPRALEDELIGSGISTNKSRAIAKELQAEADKATIAQNLKNEQLQAANVAKREQELAGSLKAKQEGELADLATENRAAGREEWETTGKADVEASKYDSWVDEQADMDRVSADSFDALMAKNDALADGSVATQKEADRLAGQIEKDQIAQTKIDDRRAAVAAKAQAKEDKINLGSVREQMTRADNDWNTDNIGLELGKQDKAKLKELRRRARVDATLDGDLTNSDRAVLNFQDEMVTKYTKTKEDVPVKIESVEVKPNVTVGTIEEVKPDLGSATAQADRAMNLGMDAKGLEADLKTAGSKAMESYNEVVPQKVYPERLDDYIHTRDTATNETVRDTAQRAIDEIVGGMPSNADTNLDKVYAEAAGKGGTKPSPKEEFKMSDSINNIRSEHKRSNFTTTDDYRSAPTKDHNMGGDEAYREFGERLIKSDIRDAGQKRQYASEAATVDEMTRQGVDNPAHLISDLEGKATVDNLDKYHQIGSDSESTGLQKRASKQMARQVSIKEAFGSDKLEAGYQLAKKKDPKIKGFGDYITSEYAPESITSEQVAKFYELNPSGVTGIPFDVKKKYFPEQIEKMPTKEKSTSTMSAGLDVPKTSSEKTMDRGVEVLDKNKSEMFTNLVNARIAVGTGKKSPAAVAAKDLWLNGGLTKEEITKLFDGKVPYEITRLKKWK